MVGFEVVNVGRTAARNVLVTSANREIGYAKVLVLPFRISATLEMIDISEDILFTLEISFEDFMGEQCQSVHILVVSADQRSFVEVHGGARLKP